MGFRCERLPGKRDAFEWRLYTNMQKALVKYVEKIRESRHAFEVVVDSLKSMRGSSFFMRAGYQEQVKDLTGGSRGRKLPRTFSPLVLANLFSK